MEINGATTPILRQEIATQIHAISPELLVLKNKYGMVFEDVDYDCFEANYNRNIPTVKRIAQSCPLKPLRRDLIESKIKALGEYGELAAGADAPVF